MNPTVIIAAAAAFAIWNIIVFALYAIDKRKAEKSKWRISESTLILCAFLMGGIGAFLGMRILRHKTQKMKFTVSVPLALVLNIAVIAALVWL
ncbi:MAG: DUF1294 domain-containing protein [Firmicutes bacterium]|nr:DUF1294 domain-containing protein [Bacillota bacterium]